MLGALVSLLRLTLLALKPIDDRRVRHPGQGKQGRQIGTGLRHDRFGRTGRNTAYMQLDQMTLVGTGRPVHAFQSGANKEKRVADHRTRKRDLQHKQPDSDPVLAQSAKDMDEMHG